MTLPTLEHTVFVKPGKLGVYQRKMALRTRTLVFKRSAKAIAPLVRAYLESESLRAKILYKGKFARGWRFEAAGESARVFNKTPYAIVIEMGRRADKRPPPSQVLVPWIAQKFGVSMKEARQLSFVVARAIGRKGIMARPIIRNPRVAKRVQSMFTDRVVLDLREALRAKP